jgi:hypothetical protein
MDGEEEKPDDGEEEDMDGEEEKPDDGEEEDMDGEEEKPDDGEENVDPILPPVIDDGNGEGGGKIAYIPIVAFPVLSTDNSFWANDK